MLPDGAGSGSAASTARVGPPLLEVAHSCVAMTGSSGEIDDGRCPRLLCLVPDGEPAPVPEVDAVVEGHVVALRVPPACLQVELGWRAPCGVPQRPVPES